MYHAMVFEASVSEWQMRQSVPGKLRYKDAKDFYAWTQSPYCSLKTIKFIFLPTEDCQKKLNNVSSQKLRPIPGTMKIHPVATQNDSVTRIAVRNTSCYSSVTCLSGIFLCNMWRIESLEPNWSMEG